MGPYAGVNFNLALCRLQDMYHRQPYAKVDRNPMPEWTLYPTLGLRIWPLYCNCTLMEGSEIDPTFSPISPVSMILTIKMFYLHSSFKRMFAVTT
jgi:hypothetical protein